MNFGFPFGSINGDRKYKAEMFRRYFASFIGNGVFPNPSTNLQVMAVNDNMTVDFFTGISFFDGAIGGIDANETHDIAVADGVLNRLDRAVMRFDWNQRIPYPIIIKGTPGSSPMAPDLKHDSEADDLGLAIISIKAGATKITQADITDTRMDSSVCGWSTSLVAQVDTATIFNQYAAWLAEIQASWATWSDAEKEAWYAWWADQHDTTGYVTANNIYTYFTPIVQQIGNGVDKEFTITHNFTGMQYPDVKMVVTETGEEVIPDNTYLSETAVKVSFDEYIPETNEFTVIVRR